MNSCPDGTTCQNEDLIARLIAERDALRDKVDELLECAHIGANTIQMYVNEVERLREALTQIVELRPVFDNETLQAIKHISKIVSIARAALEVKP